MVRRTLILRDFARRPHTGTGEVDGAIIRDNLKIGDLELPAHVFGVATSESVEFSSDDTRALILAAMTTPQ